ncbi:MAG: hypothetical protein ACLPKE_16885, partial [Streptosporangiaceae bacterium]
HERSYYQIAAGPPSGMDVMPSLDDMLHKFNAAKSECDAAESWYQRAAAAGNVDAMTHLARVSNDHGFLRPAP